ncbi:MAG TPA: choice-of-anchor Q domain-containing protein [Flavilitoribacter sp.]|nr:choice-of-anchor Q domain-containing protein [Flavilitoribacter sp.]
MNRIISFLLSMFLWTSLPASVIYVNQAAAGVNTGESWENAFLDLQPALATAQPLDEIWIAKGTYKPTSGTDRSATFLVPNGVKLYGGFEGFEISINQRDWEGNHTILSGNIGEEFDLQDNCYHVVTINNSSELIILDGIIIFSGYADQADQGEGGGILLDATNKESFINIDIKNCQIKENYAGFGGGIAALATKGIIKLNILFSTIRNNIADAYTPAQRSGGGGIGIIAGQGNTAVTCQNTQILFNEGSFTRGGGIYFTDFNNEEGAPPDEFKIINCQFEGNYSPFGGGAIRSQISTDSFPGEISGSIFFNNEAGLQSEEGNGGALNLIGYFNITNCEFKMNGSSNGGAIYFFASKSKIANYLFNGNEALDGGAVGGFADYSQFLNCTFFNNSALNQGHISSGAIEDSLYNCIFWDTSGLNPYNYFSGGAFYFENCLWKLDSCPTVAVQWPKIDCGPGNIFNQSPRLISPSTGDFSLHRCSPAIDAGTDSLLNTWNIQTDISGMPRTEGPRPDIGAYESPGFRVNLTSLDPGCYGEATGQIEAVIDNGVAPYQINWSNDSTGLSLSKLNPGTYSMTLTDSQHCIVINQVEISSPDSLSVWYNVTGVSGPGLNDGSIQMDSIHGGTPPYLYHWNTNDTTASLSGLDVGDYDLSVTDQNGCLKTLSFEVSQVSAVRNLQDQLEAYVSPNPVKYDLPAVLHLSGLSDRPAFIRIIDASGKTIWSKPIPSGKTAEINTELPTNLPDGIYFISIHSEGNNIIRPLKWMVGKN